MVLKNNNDVKITTSTTTGDEIKIFIKLSSISKSFYIKLSGFSPKDDITKRHLLAAIRMSLKKDDLSLPDTVPMCWHDKSVIDFPLRKLTKSAKSVIGVIFVDDTPMMVNVAVSMPTMHTVPTVPTAAVAAATPATPATVSATPARVVPIVTLQLPANKNILDLKVAVNNKIKAIQHSDLLLFNGMAVADTVVLSSLLMSDASKPGSLQSQPTINLALQKRSSEHCPVAYVCLECGYTNYLRPVDFLKCAKCDYRVLAKKRDPTKRHIYLAR